MTVPFDEPNSRIFWACQGVFVEERNTEAGNNGNPTGAEFLTGVQSVGVSSDDPSTSLLDIGRHQRSYTHYGQQTKEITISRVLNKASDTFYKVSPSQYGSYKNSHILHVENFGSKGAKNSTGKTLRNYDITILYGSDKFSQLGAGNAVTPPDPDANDIISVSYLNCLITNISYSMGVDRVEETITLTTKNSKYNNDYSTLSDYNLPTEWTTAATKKEATITFDDGAATKNATNKVINKTYSDVNVTPPKYKYQEGNILKRQDFDFLLENYGHSKIPLEVVHLFNFNPPKEEGFNSEIIDPELQILGIQSIDIDISFSYTSLEDIGEWRGSIQRKEHEQNRWQVLDLPISINCSFTGTLRKAMPYNEFLPSNRFRNVDTIYTANLGKPEFRDWQETDREIRIVAKGLGPPITTQEYFIWDLGTKNYLTSIEYTGGDAGGGNVEATISYSNQYSDCVITKNTSVIDLQNDGPY